MYQYNNVISFVADCYAKDCLDVHVLYLGKLFWLLIERMRTKLRFMHALINTCPKNNEPS